MFSICKIYVTAFLVNCSESSFAESFDDLAP